MAWACLSDSLACSNARVVGFFIHRPFLSPFFQQAIQPGLDCGVLTEPAGRSTRLASALRLCSSAPGARVKRGV